jgi:hypothetical protein
MIVNLVPEKPASMKISRETVDAVNSKKSVINCVSRLYGYPDDREPEALLALIKNTHHLVLVLVPVVDKFDSD